MPYKQPEYWNHIHYKLFLRRYTLRRHLIIFLTVRMTYYSCVPYLLYGPKNYLHTIARKTVSLHIIYVKFPTSVKIGSNNIRTITHRG